MGNERDLGFQVPMNELANQVCLCWTPRFHGLSTTVTTAFEAIQVKIIIVFVYESESCHRQFSLYLYKYGKIVTVVRLFRLSKLYADELPSSSQAIANDPFGHCKKPEPWLNFIINVVIHTTCLRLVIDSRLTWATHVDHVKKSFAQKVGALRRMNKRPVKVLEKI